MWHYLDIPDTFWLFFPTSILHLFTSFLFHFMNSSHIPSVIFSILLLTLWLFFAQHGHPMHLMGTTGLIILFRSMFFVHLDYHLNLYNLCFNIWFCTTVLCFRRDTFVKWFCPVYELQSRYFVAKYQ